MVNMDIRRESAEGCKPSHTSNTPGEHTQQAPKALDPSPIRDTKTPRPPATTPPDHEADSRDRSAPPKSATPTPCTRPRGMGDRARRAGVGDGTLIGGPTQGRGSSSQTSSYSRFGLASRSPRLAVGVRVRNASGRGVWGLGTIVGVVPAGVNPRWFCRRNNLPLLFRDRSVALWHDRYVVLGDDGRHHAPKNVEEVEL